MENLIILKNNILKKKGTFLSIVFLTAIVVMTAAMIFSIRDNYATSMEDALNDVDSGNIIFMINENKLTDELLKNVEESELVNGVSRTDTVATIGSNTYFMQKMRKGIKLFTRDEKKLEETIAPLSKGEIYLPLGVKNRLDCKIGDTVTFKMLDKERSFTVKGFVIEPSNGSSTIGWKQVFVNDEEFEEMKSANRALATDQINTNYVLLNVYKADETLSDLKFQRKLNLETKVSDYSLGSMTREQSSKYTLLFFEIISTVVMVFNGLLWAIVLIVIAHSISNEIENDYTNLGILKSVGFNERKIQIIIALQYIIAQGTGILVGCIFSIPLTKIVSNVFVPITSILPSSGMSVLKVLMLSMVLMLVLVVVIFIKTRKVAAISPVKAMAKGKSDIYFENVCTFPISKKFFSFSMSFRNFTSNMRRYIGTVFIVAILVFFMLTVNLMVGMVSSRSAMEAMGLEVTDVDINFTASTDENIFTDIENIVEEYSEIDKKFYIGSTYMSLEGENLICRQYYYPEYIRGILKGRAPLYDNEIIISEMVADYLDMKMGDEVTVSENGKSAKYIISGIYQTANDAGMAFAMSFEGAKRIEAQNINFVGMTLKNPDRKYEIVVRLNEEFSNVVNARTVEFEDVMNEQGFDMAVTAIEIIIYSLSVVFMLVVVCMVCGKSFANERNDIGIQKALGITSSKLRLWFAIRFFVVAITGSFIGVILSYCFSDTLLNSIMSLMGLSKVVTAFTFLTVLVAGVTFFIFSYMASGKVRKVEVRELIIE